MKSYYIETFSIPLCSILLLPHVHAHCTLSLHVIVPIIIYLSTCPSLLLNWELLEGKDPHSSLYLKHNAWYRVCGWEDRRMAQHADRISYNDLECPPPHTHTKKNEWIIMCLEKDFRNVEIWVLILNSCLNRPLESHLISLDLKYSCLLNGDKA